MRKRRRKPGDGIGNPADLAPRERAVFSRDEQNPSFHIVPYLVR